MSRDIKVWTSIIIMHDKSQLRGHLTIIAVKDEQVLATSYYPIISLFCFSVSPVVVRYHIVCCRVTPWNLTETKKFVFVAAISNEGRSLVLLHEKNKQRTKNDTAGLLYFYFVRNVLEGTISSVIVYALALSRGTVQEQKERYRWSWQQQEEEERIRSRGLKTRSHLRRGCLRRSS